MFIHRDRVEFLYCFVLNCREPGNIYLLESKMVLNLLLYGFCFFVFCWTWYHTGLEQSVVEEKYSSKWTLETV